MPRDQKMTTGQDQATSDDPLFRAPDDQRGDQPFGGHSDPLRDPLDADDDRADTPIGDGIATGRHAGDEPSDAPGEWVAGNRGPDYVAGRDGSVVPGQPGEPAAERTDLDGDTVTSDTVTSDTVTGDGLPGDTTTGDRDPVTGDRVTGDTATGNGAVGDDVTGDRDPLTGDPVASGTQATTDPDSPADPDAPAATPVTSDLRTTQDPEVAPDSAFTRDAGTPVDPNAPASTEGTAASSVPSATSASATTPDAAAAGTAVTPETTAVPDTATDSATTTPAATGTATGTPVPGAPGTGSTTGVQAASAPLVSHSADLHDDWARIQSAFVDDPRGSVTQAADLVSQVTNSLVSALQEREQTLRGSWDKAGDQGPDTENLRNALRDYRAFFEMLTKV